MNEGIYELQNQLRSAGYVAGEGLATVLFLAQRLARPLLLEGPAGVGKTALAKAVAHVRQAELIRLQCYEGLDATHALYDWDYPKQLLTVRSVAGRQEGSQGGSHGDRLQEGPQDGPQRIAQASGDLYSERFLIERPLLKALRTSRPAVLLIDEIDRADEEFEALLLEFLSEFQITIPELGSFGSKVPPLVFLTSNRTRDLSDALRRRCLYYWLDYPTFEHETEIIGLYLPDVAPDLIRQVVRGVRRLRKWSLLKPPGLAESIDWATALRELEVETLDETVTALTMGCLLKTQEDAELLQSKGLASLWNA